VTHALNVYLDSYLQHIHAQSFEVYCLGMRELLNVLKMPKFAAWFMQCFASDDDCLAAFEVLSQFSVWKSFRTHHLCPPNPDFETHLYYEELRLQDLLSLDLSFLFFCPETQTPTSWLPYAQPSHDDSSLKAIQKAYRMSQLYIDELVTAVDELDHELGADQLFLLLNKMQQKLFLISRIEQVSEEMHKLYTETQNLLKDLSLYLVKMRLKSQSEKDLVDWLEQFEERYASVQESSKQLYRAGGALVPFEIVFNQIEERYRVLNNLLDEDDYCAA
jgi:hypothetical protein